MRYIICDNITENHVWWGDINRSLKDHLTYVVDIQSYSKKIASNLNNKIHPGEIVFKVSGNARQLLGAERLVLNCMQRMSGIATYTRYLKSLIKNSCSQLLDTRKTTPNFRIAEKWAVEIGGGVNHRFGLYDMVILKDNHIHHIPLDVELLASPDHHLYPLHE